MAMEDTLAKKLLTLRHKRVLEERAQFNRDLDKTQLFKNTNRKNNYYRQKKNFE